MSTQREAQPVWADTRTTLELIADRLTSHRSVERACAIIRARDAETLGDMRTVVRIAAPSLDEGDRALWMRERLCDAGAHDTGIDDAGNVVANRPGAHADRPPIVVAAHVDTVFPRSVDLTLHETDGRLAAPGIADNARGLAALLAITRALGDAGIRTVHPIVLAATVGEEGLGDLRGVKHLFRERGPLRRAAGFIALDGTGIRRIVHRAVGSRRLRVRVTGPGGHSWANRGTPNPIHTLAEAAAQLARAAPAPGESASLAIGRIGGGTSVNAIPEEAWLEVDLRAEAARDLADLEQRIRAIVNRVIDAANAGRRHRTSGLASHVDVIGDRPSGATPATSPLVRAARAATRHVGARPELIAASTDANVPIALGIPAIALGAGGESGRSHTTDEWFSNDRGPEGIQRVLLTLLAVAGIAG